MGTALDLTLAILNGAVGDYLARTGNGLATEMSCVRDGRTLPVDRAAVARAYPVASPRVVILLHGLMSTEAIWRLPDGSDYGALLARDLGFTPIYIRYNSGLAIEENGAAFARLLETLLRAYPVPIEEILLLGYSMGGLIARSACQVATREGHDWLGRVRRAIYFGTPHFGTPLERTGRLVAEALGAVNHPVTRLAADLGNLRSKGIKDLGGPLHLCPLVPSIQHYLVAGTLSPTPWLAALFGDAIVPVPSATAGACADPSTMALPPAHVRIFAGLGHLDLPRRPEVYEQIRTWCEEENACPV